MPFFSFSAQVILLIFNVALASIILSFVAVLVGLWARRWTLPTRHGLFCIALVLILVSPLAIWVTSGLGFGVVPIAIGSLDRGGSPALESSLPAELAGDGVVVSVSSPNLITTKTHDTDDDQSRIESSSTVEPKQETLEITADTMPKDLAGAVSPGAPGSNQKLSRVEVMRSIVGVLSLVWAAVAFWLLVKLVRGLFVIWQLRRSLQPITDVRIIHAMHQVYPNKEGTKTTTVFESPVAPAPLTLGLWRSVIVMPEGLAESLNDEELACVLAHEMAHVTRHDTSIAILQQLAGIGFWWNPLLRHINRQIGCLRERICDDHVVKRFGDGLPLAEAILKVAEWSTTRKIPIPLATTLLDDAGDIEQRITRLMKPDRTFSIKLSVKSTALIGLIGIILAAIPLMPAVRAQIASTKTVAPEKVTTKTVDSDSQAGKWRVLIRVIDTEGNPISNPQIGIQLGGKNERIWQAGDRDGRFTATLSTRTPRYCYLLARADGYAPMRAFWGINQDYAEDPLPAEFTFKMTKAITVGGTVVDQYNQPIANASVLFSAGSKKTNPVQRAQDGFFEKKYMTDQKGQWRCHLVPSTISDASIKVTHPDYVSPSATYDQSKQISELRDLKHTWTLKKGFEITGRVVDKEGTPVEGAVLALGELNTSAREGPFALTDPDGWYRFEQVSPQYDTRSVNSSIAFTVTIMKRGYRPVFESVPGFGNRPLKDSTEQKRIVNFTLKRGVKLKLHVVDSQNQPVKGAWVMLKSWHDTTALQVVQKYAVPTETDAQGNWEWDNAPPDEPIRYDILKRGFADIRDLQITVDGAETEKTVILKQPQFITGKVIDAKTRQSITKFIVERAFENMAGHPDGLSWASDLTRGKNGTYKKRVTMLPYNGHYTYRARAEGYETAVSKSTPFEEGKTTVVNFELQPKPKVPKSVSENTPPVPQVINTLTGRIVDKKQQGIGGAEMLLVSYLDIQTGRISKGRVIDSTIADSEGNYSFKLLAEEIKKQRFVSVWAKADGYVARGSRWSATNSAVSERKPLEISLAATAGTWVDVLDPAGNPLAGVRVIPRKIVFSQGAVGDPLPPKWEVQSTGTTGVDGKAHMPHVVPGSLYELVLIPPGNMGSMQYNFNFFLNVRPAKKAPHFTLRLPEMGSVKGQLVVAEGFALPKDLQLTLQSVPRMPPGFKNIVDVPIGADGKFSIDKLAVGSIFVPAFLSKNQPLRANVPGRIEVKANQETQLKIPVAPGIKVYGRVQKSDTKENVKNYGMTLIYGQTVSNRGADFDWLKFNLVTDAEGRFQCIVPPGPINLRCTQYADGYRAVTSWLPRKKRGRLGMKFEIPDQDSFDLGTIELVKMVPITGQVVDLKNERLIGWSVYGFPKIPGFTQSETMNSMAGVETDKKGTFKGSYPETYPPAYWRVSHRVWKTRYEWDNPNYAAKVISHEPFVLQVDTSKEWQYGEQIPYDTIPLQERISPSDTDQ